MITIEKVNALADNWTEISGSVNDLMKTIDVGDADDSTYLRLASAFTAFKTALATTWDNDSLQPCPECDCTGCDYCDQSGFKP